MAEKSYLWTTDDTGDGAAAGYSAADLHLVFRGLFGKTANRGGVSPDYLNELAVAGSSSPVSVATGAAVVAGVPYVNTAAVEVAIPTPSGATRIDRIVLRASWAAQTVRVTRVAGSEGGAAPALTQSEGTTWDIPLAQVSITTGGVITVTDEREWLDATGDGAVTEAKIGAAAVTEAKIGAAAVTADKIGSGAVVEAKIGAAAVTADKIGAGAVTEAKIGAAAVTADKIGSGAVTQAKLGSDTLRMMTFPLYLPNEAVNFDHETTILNRFAAVLNKDKLPAGATVYLLARGYNTLGYGSAVVWVRALPSSTQIGSVTLQGGGNTYSVAKSLDFYDDLPAGETHFDLFIRCSDATAELSGVWLLVEW